jgi:HK97 gp10 family phage protein
MKVRVQVEGLSEMKDAFLELPKATGKNVIKRILTKLAQPIARDAESRAPVKTGHLKTGITVGTKLSRRQASLAKDTKSYTEVYAGAGTHPQATLQEFGTSKDKPQPFMRPAWDSAKGSLLSSLAEDLWDEISKAADRIARKTARQAAKKG